MALTTTQWNDFINLYSNAYVDYGTRLEGGFDLSKESTQKLQQFSKQYGLKDEVFRGQYYTWALIDAREQAGLGAKAVNKVWDLANIDLKSVDPWKRYRTPELLAEDFFSFRQQQTFSKSSVWDSVFHPFGGTTSIVEFLNPITSVKAVSKIGNSSESNNFITNTIKPSPVNYLDELFKGTTNVVGSIGFGFGVEGATQAATAYASATTPLTTGVQGPVNPGFWSTLTSGNIKGAWDILASPVSSFAHSSSTDSGFSSLSKSTAIGQLINEFVGLTGKIGRGIVQIISGNFNAGIKTFVEQTPSTPPSIVPPNIFGNYQAGGGGSGLGVGGNTGQSTTNPLVFPVMGIAALLVVWLIVRKK